MNAQVQNDCLFLEFRESQLVDGFLDVFYGMFFVLNDDYTEIDQFCNRLRIGNKRGGVSITTISYF